MAAGRGTRLQPFTDTVPKPLLPVRGVPIVEHTLMELPNGISEIIFVVGYRGDQIKKHFGDVFGTVPIRYVEQTTLDGTYGALRTAASFLSGRFLVLNGDDMYVREDLTKLSNGADWGLLVQRSATPVPSGAVVTEDNRVMRLANKSEQSFLRLCGAYVLDSSIFDCPGVAIRGSGGSTEYGLPQTILLVADIHMICAYEATSWQPVGTVEEYTRVM